VISEPCIDVKDQSCVEVCPVDCIHSTDSSNQYFIDPDECIDCGVCEPECPPEAILPDSDNEAEKWLELNREYSEIWPNITRKGEAPADAEEFRDKPGKYEKFFSREPGNTDG
jgi:ferredoxin